MTVSFPNLAPGNPIRASELNTNNADFAAMLRGLTVENFDDDAGITSRHLADRFGALVIPFHLFPRMGATGAVAQLIDLSLGPTNWTMPNVAAATELVWGPVDLLLEVGKQHKLIGITGRYVNSTGTPRLWFTVNGQVLGAGPVSLTANPMALYDAVDPFASPIRTVQNGDQIAIYAGNDGAAATARMVTGAWVFAKENGR